MPYGFLIDKSLILFFLVITICIQLFSLGVCTRTLYQLRRHPSRIPWYFFTGVLGLGVVRRISNIPLIVNMFSTENILPSYFTVEIYLFVSNILLLFGLLAIRHEHLSLIHVQTMLVEEHIPLLKDLQYVLKHENEDLYKNLEQSKDKLHEAQQITEKSLQALSKYTFTPPHEGRKNG